MGKLKGNDIKKAQKVFNVFLVLLGSLVLAFGDAFFIVPCNLITGGCTSIGIIIQTIVNQSFGTSYEFVDIVAAVLQAILFFVGLFALGKKFALNTLLASIAYPLFLALFYRLNIGNSVSSSIASSKEPLLLTLVYGIFGGLCLGTGVGLAFLGKGSTGGMDVLSHLLSKITRVKVNIFVFALDALVILIGMLVLKNPIIGFMGIISAFVCSLMIKAIYVAFTSYSTAHIISSKYNEISRFIQDALGRGCTIMDVFGGYKNEKRKMIWVALNNEEAFQLKLFISQIDPEAFITFQAANGINGEGFAPFMKHKVNLTELDKYKKEDGK